MSPPLGEGRMRVGLAVLHRFSRFYFTVIQLILVLLVGEAR